MKEAVLIKIFAYSDIEETEKQALLLEVIGNGKSDMIDKLKLACEASLPSIESKQRVWDKIIDTENELSTHQRTTYMAHFFKRDEFCPMFRDKYIEEVLKMADYEDTEFAINFIATTAPIACATDDLVEKLKMQTSVSKLLDTNSHPIENSSRISYIRIVTQITEVIERSLKVKQFTSQK